MTTQQSSLPLGFLRHPDLPAGTTTEYTKIHQQARRNMDSQCSECDATEPLEAALRNDAVAESLRVDQRGRRYSINIEDYQALCRPCHRKADGFAACQPYCKHGHKYTPENTRICVDGSRRCRTCTREQAARIKAKRAPKRKRAVPALPNEPIRLLAEVPDVMPRIERKIHTWLKRYTENRGIDIGRFDLEEIAHGAYMAIPKHVRDQALGHHSPSESLTDQAAAS